MSASHSQRSAEVLQLVLHEIRVNKERQIKQGEDIVRLEVEVGNLKEALRDQKQSLAQSQESTGSQAAVKEPLDKKFWAVALAAIVSLLTQIVDHLGQLVGN